MDSNHLCRSASSSRPTREPTQWSEAAGPCSRELAERVCSGTEVRLLWWQGTGQVWVEVKEAATARVLRIQVEPERALDAFHHPYAYADARGSLSLVETLDARERKSHAAEEQFGGQ